MPSADHLLTILNTIYDIVFSIEPVRGADHQRTGRYRFTAFSQSFLTVTGLSERDVLGHDIGDVIAPANYRVAVARIEDAIVGRAPVFWDAASVWPAGVKHGLFVVTPIFTIGGECTEVICWVHDTAACRKMAEARGVR